MRIGIPREIKDNENRVAMQPDGIGVREAARRTGIDRSAVSRILTQFEEMGYIEQERERGLYRAGPQLFSLVAALADAGVKMGALGPTTVRAVTHLDVDAGGVEHAVAAVRAAVAAR